MMRSSDTHTVMNLKVGRLGMTPLDAHWIDSETAIPAAIENSGHLSKAKSEVLKTPAGRPRYQMGMETE